MRRSMIDIIGTTSVVKLRLGENGGAKVFAKMEMSNPFGMKDRVAKKIILDGKRTGKLKEGAPIIESSSGTLALGIALVGTYLGHEVHIVTDPRIDELTYKKLKALGANIHIVNKMNKTGGWQQARLDYLFELMKEFQDAFWPNQYDNPLNLSAYYSLAEELIQEIEDIDILVGSVGSGGSLCGTAEALKKYNPNLKVVAVDAIGSAIFKNVDYPKRLQSGIGNSLKPANVKRAIIDEVHWLNDQEAFNWTLKLARDEKIFAGNSSGSVYAVARWLSSQVNEDINITCIFPDRGDRYFETIYDELFFESNELKIHSINDKPKCISTIENIESWSYKQFNKEKFSNEKAHVY